MLSLLGGQVGGARLGRFLRGSGRLIHRHPSLQLEYVRQLDNVIVSNIVFAFKKKVKKFKLLSKCRTEKP